jgi:single-strand DNA-binding protein
MTRGINNVILVGALVRDPELRYTPNGAAVLSFTIGGDSTATDDRGEVRSIAWYHRAEYISKQAESLADSLKAGSPVLLEGRLEYQMWENEMGERRSRVVLRVNQLEVLSNHNDRLTADRAGGFRLLEGVNRATIAGNLTKDIVLRQTSSGTPVASLSIAVNESWRDAKGEWQSKGHFIDVTLWGSLAEQAAALTKGSPVLVMGRLESDSWTDAQGQKRNKLQVNAERLELLERRAVQSNQVVETVPFEPDFLEPAPQLEPVKTTAKRGRQTRAAA